MKIKHFSRSKISAMLTILLVTMLACVGQGTSTPIIPENPAQPGAPGSGWLEIYFSDPMTPYAGSFEGGPDEALAAAIDSARLSVDVAAYSLNLWSIRNALVDAHARGVVVRVVMESDNMDGEEVQDLVITGIEVLGDRREGLMHNKFVVIDRSEVWMGSMNYTTNGAYEDNNNLLRVRSVQVAEDYTTEFNEMFVEDLFGTDDRAATPNPSVTIDDTRVEVYFSPDDGVANRLEELLQGAQESIYFLAYSFTSNSLGEAIMERAKAGVTVAGIMDNGQAASNMGTEYDAFMLAGLDVWLDGNEGLMHHKVLIIDESIVVTGSYNFTANAEENNDENVIILHDTAAAAIFMEEFQRVYDQALQP
jgi:phosphatidylserine/phosphatidylglycerophosphate/cardiolipin synthase-like enzyme